MTLNQIRQENEERFNREFVGHDGSFCWELDKPLEVVPNLKSFLRQSEQRVIDWYEKRFLEIYEAVDKAKYDDRDALLIDKVTELYGETCQANELQEEPK